MKFHKMYLEGLWVQNAFGSAHIEGNRLSYQVTENILNSEDDADTINNAIENIYSNINSNERIKMINEIIGFRNIEPLFDNCLNKNEDITIELINSFHSRLMRRVLPDENLGIFRNKNKMITNSHVVLSHYNVIEKDLSEIIEKYQSMIQNSKNLNDKIDALVFLHVGFETVHPFEDGNGRVGRMLLTYESIRNGLPPLIIKENQAQQYYLGLTMANETDEFNSNEILPRINFDNFNYLKTLFLQNMQEEFNIITKDEPHFDMLLEKKKEDLTKRMNRISMDPLKSEFVDFYKRRLSRLDEKYVVFQDIDSMDPEFDSNSETIMNRLSDFIFTEQEALALKKEKYLEHDTLNLNDASELEM
ncbi:Fic family protein [Williamsoniiplasma luminosum]|nr:Fic family protein [Williamsoniiplasma luminosum]